MKNTLEGINSRISEAKERISELEDSMVEITAVELNKEKRMERNEDTLKGLWDNIISTNNRIIQVLEEEEKEKGPEKIFEEIIVEKFPNTGKEIVNQVQEARLQILVEEEKEELKIREELTKTIYKYSEKFLEKIEHISDLDFLMAKVRFAKEYKGIRPV